jgi:hypothetical protein
MRYIIYISVILAAMLVAKTVNLPRGATASHDESNDKLTWIKETVRQRWL